MKHLSAITTRVALFVLVILLGCQQDDERNIKISPKLGPNLDGLIKEQAENPNARVLVQHQLFAFEGDNLYRVHSDTREVQYLGSGWSNTESATILNGFLYAAQVGHLWKCNLTSGAITDLGNYWDQTPFLTNDGSSLFAIQVGLLWKINPSNGNFVAIGPCGWDNSTEMAFSHAIGSGGTLFIEQIGRIWTADKNTGNCADYSAAVSNPYTFPHPSGGACGSCMITIHDGRLITYDLAQPVILVHYQSPAAYAGATDISYTHYSPTGSSVAIHNVFILKDSQISHLAKTGSPIDDEYDLQGIVPGLNNVYKIVSTQGL